MCKPARFPAFTRFNVFLRDRFTCQYCGDARRSDLRPRGAALEGRLTTWENVVTACSHCNLIKGDLLPRRHACVRRTAPYQPTVNELQQNGRALPAQLSARELADYLYWDSELEQE